MEITERIPVETPRNRDGKGKTGKKAPRKKETWVALYKEKEVLCLTPSQRDQ